MSQDIEPGKAPPRLVAPLINFALVLAATLVIVAMGEALFRYRFGPGGYRPSPAVLDIQEHLVTQPEYGFAWRPNVRADEQIVFDVADVEFLPLSTDADGFINHPDAQSNREVDVLGLGDSFIEHAAHEWFELAKDRGLDYHSLALHRTAPPQYARIFEAHGLAMKPKWVVIGLFENDFTETSDFLQWSDSGMDWFAYHSGTWCGPPIDDSVLGRILNGPLVGWQLAYRNARANLRGERMSVAGPNKTEIAGVDSALEDIVAKARAIDSRILVLIIPSKPTALNAPTREAEACDFVIDKLTIDSLGAGDAIGVIDLRQVFRDHPNPASLYYEVDGHWNRNGIELAGTLVFDHIQHEMAEAQ